MQGARSGALLLDASLRAWLPPDADAPPWSASGFTGYAYAFVQQNADAIQPESVERAAALGRAKRLM